MPGNGRELQQRQLRQICKKNLAFLQMVQRCDEFFETSFSILDLRLVPKHPKQSKTMPNRNLTLFSSHENWQWAGIGRGSNGGAICKTNSMSADFHWSFQLETKKSINNLRPPDLTSIHVIWDIKSLGISRPPKNVGKTAIKISCNLETHPCGCSFEIFCWPRSPMKLWNATSSDAAEWWDTKREISVIDLLVKEKEHKKDTILFSLVSETGTIKISVQEACITCNLRYKIKLVSKPTQPTLDASRCLLHSKISIKRIDLMILYDYFWK